MKPTYLPMSTPTHLLAPAMGKMRPRPLLAPLVLVSCATPGMDARPTREALVDIQGSAASLAAWFDQERDTPRAILLLSPV